MGDLRLYFPRVQEADLVKAHVVKEQRATFSARPGTESLRPTAESGPGNVVLVGDWTRSGYLAAEAVAQRAGRPARFLLPDLAG